MGKHRHDTLVQRCGAENVRWLVEAGYLVLREGRLWTTSPPSTWRAAARQAWQGEGRPAAGSPGPRRLTRLLPLR